jgi:FkbH-like protein
MGEGAVEHFTARQAIVKQLKSRGILLALNSKNDPKNVRWAGSSLSAADFVCTQINWNDKSANLRRIGQLLNLKTKDFVFIDDRPDERALVNMAMPEVYTLDATSDRAWRRLNLWSQQLGDPGKADRTLFYKQKEQRDDFLQTQTAEEDQGKLFEKLGLAITLYDAGKPDMKRVVELINRTNQFNTCGSRSTIREATDWLTGGDRRILMVDCEDKFGSMGTVCVAAIQGEADRVVIPIFVLSCRVFGYGIENAVVNVVKRLAQQRRVPLVGLFKETAHNDPCKTVYAENGFTRNGKDWVYEREGAINDPTWLTIHCANPEFTH